MSSAPRLRPQLRDHGRRQVDPVHANAPPAERQRDTAGADAQLERGAVSRQIGEEAHRRVDDRGLEHVRRGRVVPLRDPFVEVDLGHRRTVAEGPGGWPPICLAPGLTRRWAPAGRCGTGRPAPGWWWRPAAALSSRQRPVNRGNRIASPASSLSCPQPAVWLGERVSSALRTSSTSAGLEPHVGRLPRVHPGRPFRAGQRRQPGRQRGQLGVGEAGAALADGAERVGGRVVRGQQQRAVDAAAAAPPGERADHDQVDGVGQLGAVVPLELDPLPAAGAGLVAGGRADRLAQQALAAVGDRLLEGGVQRAPGVLDLDGGGQPQPVRWGRSPRPAGPAARG